MSASVNVWVIVGESNAGKSSSIRALTGIRNQSLYMLRTKAGILLNNVFVIPSSLQEFYQVQPSDFVARVQRNFYLVKQRGPIDSTEQPSTQSFDNVLVSLRQTGINGCPDANVYIMAFASAGWHVQVPVVHLQLPGCVFLPTTPHISIDVAATSGGVQVPSNEKASIIREAWGWR